MDTPSSGADLESVSVQGNRTNGYWRAGAARFPNRAQEQIQVVGGGASEGRQRVSCVWHAAPHTRLQRQAGASIASLLRRRSWSPGSIDRGDVRPEGMGK